MRSAPLGTKGRKNLHQTGDPCQRCWEKNGRLVKDPKGLKGFHWLCLQCRKELSARKPVPFIVEGTRAWVKSYSEDYKKKRQPHLASQEFQPRTVKEWARHLRACHGVGCKFKRVHKYYEGLRMMVHADDPLVGYMSHQKKANLSPALSQMVFRAFISQAGVVHSEKPWSITSVRKLRAGKVKKDGSWKRGHAAVPNRFIDSSKPKGW